MMMEHKCPKCGCAEIWDHDCPNCGSSGVDPLTNEDCEECDGSGYHDGYSECSKCGEVGMDHEFETPSLTDQAYDEYRKDIEDNG